MISVSVSMKRVLSIRTGSGRVEDEYLRQGRVFKRGGQKGSTWNERSASVTPFTAYELLVTREMFQEPRPYSRPKTRSVCCFRGLLGVSS